MAGLSGDSRSGGISNGQSCLNSSIFRFLDAFLTTLTVGLILMCAPRSSMAEEKWSPDVFDYDPPDRLDVRDAPTRRPYNISGTRQEEVFFKDLRGHDVPVLITMPAERPGP